MNIKPRLMRIRTGIGFCLLLGMIATPAAAQSSSSQSSQQNELVAAYQREFVYLDNEIRLLQERLEEVNTDGQERVEAARRDLKRLETRLLELNAQVDRRTEDLSVVEEEANKARDTNDALDNIIAQGNARLRDNDVPTISEAGILSEEEDVTAGDRLALELDYVFMNSFDVLETLGTIRTEPGAFYLKSGEEVQGTITRVGEIAGLGLAGEYGGTLAPAGGGRLWLVHPESEPVAKRLVDGPGEAETVPLFIYESLDELVDPSRGATLMETIEGGGIIGVVILVIGAISLILIGLRAFFLWRAGSRNETTLNRVFEHVQQGKMKKALAAAEEHRGALGRVIQATVRGLRTDPKNIEDVISESVLNEQPALDRFRSALSVFAAVAPLLGLLGTVTGMIATFDVITQYGTGDPKLLSGGISEALITTELGLTVAIPVLLIGNLLSSWSDRITSNIEVSALRIVNISSGIDTAEQAEEA